MECCAVVKPGLGEIEQADLEGYSIQFTQTRFLIIAERVQQAALMRLWPVRRSNKRFARSAGNQSRMSPRKPSPAPGQPNRWAAQAGSYHPTRDNRPDESFERRTSPTAVRTKGSSNEVSGSNNREGPTSKEQQETNNWFAYCDKQVRSSRLQRQGLVRG